MLLVVGATLAVFSTMERRTRDDSRLSDQERTARVAIDTMAKRLRNLASPQSAGAAPQALERAEAQDLMFRTVDVDGHAARRPTSRTSSATATASARTGGSTPSARPTASWTATPPNPTSCGTSDGWPGERDGRRPEPRQRRATRLQVPGEPDPGHLQRDEHGHAGELPQRHRRSAPSCSSTWTRNAAPGADDDQHARVPAQPEPAADRQLHRDLPDAGSLVTLNASDSADPENNPLYYQWLDNGTVVQAFSQQATYAFRATAGGDAHDHARRARHRRPAGHLQRHHRHMHKHRRAREPRISRLIAATSAAGRSSPR